MLHFDEPVSFVKGATPTVRKAWESLGIKTIGDLLMTIPRRYDDYSKIVPIREAQAGEVVTIRGKILTCKKLPSFRKRFQMFRATLKDETGVIGATFFNQPWVLDEFKPEREVFWSGKVTVHPRFGKSMAHPLWEPVDREVIASGKIAPVYPLSGALTQKRYRQLIQQTLDNVEFPSETLGDETRHRWNLVTEQEAILKIHRPTLLEEAEQGRERLAFDELLSYQLAFGMAQKQSVQAGAPAIPFDERFAKQFVSKLPFALTADQKRAVWAVLQDMESEAPMRRLLQGDVGSGKTVVAAFLMAHVHRAGMSSALLAPTDILAKQHAATLNRFLAPHRISLALVTRTDKPEDLAKIIKQGNVVMVGTHALLEANRLPADLALAIVDEQHRFGVAQREALLVTAREDGQVPHFLSMTATPIPRSLALTLYGDLKISSLQEKPAGRIQIKTSVCVGEDRENAYEAIRQAAVRHEQSFIVCPLIDASDVLGVRSVTEEWKRLSKDGLAGLRVGLLHGRLKAQEKDELMIKMAEGQLDVLIATTVIEVGVDVPRATVMAIEGAERFGLAQLHQLRGRVGRSTLPSYCFLMTDVQGEALDRLKLVARTSDGFKLAEEDLKLRGAGNLLGKEQSGQALFQAARMTDLRLMTAAREQAEEFLKEDASLKKFPAWKERVDHLRQTSHLE